MGILALQKKKEEEKEAHRALKGGSLAPSLYGLRIITQDLVSSQAVSYLCCEARN